MCKVGRDNRIEDAGHSEKTHLQGLGKAEAITCKPTDRHRLDGNILGLPADALEEAAKNHEWDHIPVHS